MCILPSLSQKLGEAVGVEKPYDASVLNNLLGESMGNPGHPKKQPAITPAIERQAYKTPIPRDTMSAADRRRMAGVTTGSQGVTAPASTTRLPVGGG